jgi:hypothetical protein
MPAVARSWTVTTCASATCSGPPRLIRGAGSAASIRLSPKRWAPISSSGSMREASSRGAEWTVEAALLHPSAGIESLDQVIDVTARTSIVESDGTSCNYVFDGVPAKGQMLTVFVSARSTTSRLINYLLPDAAEQFIEVGLDPLVEALGDLVPDPVGFVFYDQPAAGFYKWDQISGDLGNSLLFAPTLPDAASRGTGETFARALLALVRDVGPETLRLRARFYAAYSALMNEAFSGTLRRWAEGKGILLTGHEILPHISSWSLNGGFTSIDPRVALAVDFFGIDAYRHETAVDSNNFVAAAGAQARRFRCPLEWPEPLRRRNLCQCRANAGARRRAMGTDAGNDAGTGHPALLPRHAPVPLAWRLPDRRARRRSDAVCQSAFRLWAWHQFRAVVELSRSLRAGDCAHLRLHRAGKPHTPVAILYPLQTAFAQGPRHSHATHIGAWCEGLLRRAATSCSSARAIWRRQKSRMAGCWHPGSPSMPSSCHPSPCWKRGTPCGRSALSSDAGGVVWSSGGRLSTVCDAVDRAAQGASAHIEGMPGSRDIDTLWQRFESSGPDVANHSGERRGNGSDMRPMAGGGSCSSMMVQRRWSARFPSATASIARSGPRRRAR